MNQSLIKEVNMSEFNQTHPVGQGSMSGRRMGRGNFSTDDEIKRALAGLIAVVIIAVSERAWNWIREKRSKSDLNEIN
jgi:hypothetical protein